MSNVENYILCSRPATEDPAFGIREALIKEIEKQFTIVWLRDLEAKPSLGVKIVAALISGLPVERQMVEDHLDILPNLQIIANNGVGMDHVNVKFYKSRGIKMANTPAVLSDACADMALGMIIAAARNILDDPASYLDDYITEIEKVFRIVWLEDLIAQPALGVDIEAAVLRPWYVVERSLVNDYIHLLPNFKLAFCHTAGMELIDVDFLKTKGIKVGYAPYVQDDACADMAIGLLLATARNIIEGVKIAMSSSMPSFNFNYLGTEVTGATLGIVGMGGIGYRIAKRARGFDMNLLYHNRRQRSTEEEESVGATYCPTLHGLLTQSDFVVIACPQTSETEGLISDAEFDAMKSTAILVNISRGKIINQDALVRALQENKIHRAALDVTDPEPLPRSHPLLTLPNLIITPHIASATEKTRMTMLRLMLDNVQACLEGKPLLTEYTG